MSKLLLTLIAFAIAQNAYAFGESVSKPAPTKPATAAPGKQQAKPAPAVAPAPKKVAAPVAQPPAPVPDPAKVKADAEQKAQEEASRKAAADEKKAAAQAARQAKLAQKRKKEDDLIAFVNQNESCSADHAWGRIKDSGYTETKAPARVKTAVRNSIHPNTKGCQEWLAKNAPAPVPSAPVAEKPAPVDQVATPAPAPSAAEKATGAVTGLFSKLKASVKQGATENTCGQAERAMNACR